MTHNTHSDLRGCARIDERGLPGAAVPAGIPVAQRGSQAPIRRYALVSGVNCAG
jgi:hypothetical protein